MTFRTGLSVITSLIVVFIIGGPLIRIFSEKMITGPIRQDGPIDHIVKKSGTPTMGGVSRRRSATTITTYPVTVTGMPGIW